MNLFRFEALGLLSKRKEVFDGIRWDGQTYREILVGLKESRPSARLLPPLRGLHSFLLFAAPFPREDGAKFGGKNVK